MFPGLRCLISYALNNKGNMENSEDGEFRLSDWSIDDLKEILEIHERRAREIKAWIALHDAADPRPRRQCVRASRFWMRKRRGL